MLLGTPIDLLLQLVGVGRSHSTPVFYSYRLLAPLPNTFTVLRRVLLQQAIPGLSYVPLLGTDLAARQLSRLASQGILFSTKPQLYPAPHRQQQVG